MNSDTISTVAFYLPQFYPFHENDEWWGTGFTEWTNVTKAQPLFDGHYQPHLPTELGFYDLRVSETQVRQAQLAKEFGVDAFCYHYYWFSGKRLLDLPVDNMLANSEIEMPFMLCWANENWTRRWDAGNKEILIAQEHNEGDELGFIESVIPFFKDPRYVKRDNCPILLVYRPDQIDECCRVVNVWRERCVEEGFGGLYLVAAFVHGIDDYLKFGFDAGVQFPPHSPQVEDRKEEVKLYRGHDGMILSFKELAESYLSRRYLGDEFYRCVFPSWDNTSRTGPGALVVLDACPSNFEHWLKLAFEEARQRLPPNRTMVFINAWNEWAEGCHLEPDRKYGRGYLEAIRRVVDGRSETSGFVESKRSRRKRSRSRNALASLYADIRNGDIHSLYLSAYRFKESLKRIFFRR